MISLLEANRFYDCVDDLMIDTKVTEIFTGLKF